MGDVNIDAAPMKEPAGYHHGDLRRALIEAALALLAQSQDWGFSLREVARRAGVSHNAPYNHFADKRALLGAIAEAGFEALRARMLAAAAPTDGPEAALVAIGVAYVTFGTAHPAQYRLMFGPAPTPEAPGRSLPEAPDRSLPGAPAPAPHGKAMAARSVLGEVIARGIAAGRFDAQGESEAEILALAAWSLVHGMTMLAIDGLVPGGGAAVAARVGQVLLDGVRVR